MEREEAVSDLKELVPQFIEAIPICPDKGVYSIYATNDGPRVKCSVHGTRETSQSSMPSFAPPSRP